MYMLLLLESGSMENVSKSWVLLRELIEGEENNM